MRTTTVRLEDFWADMVEAVAKRDDCRPADILRDAVREYLIARAEGDPELDKLLKQAEADALAESEARAREQFQARVFRSNR